MKPAISYYLPVHNAQAALPQLVAQSLEVLSEQPAAFELLIVDSASTDATAEVAYELSVCYPQVRLVDGNARLQGLPESLQRHARGQALIMGQENEPCDLRDLPPRVLGERLADIGRDEPVTVSYRRPRRRLGYLARSAECSQGI